MKIKALEVGIYEEKGAGNCSNNGISERFRSVYVVCPEGNCVFDTEDKLPENLVKIVNKTYSFGTFTHAEPFIGNGKWWMAGGDFIYACDSRFTKYFGHSPIALHDRCEF